MGTGKVMLMTTSVDKEWTNLPERPAYIVLLMEMMQYLAKPASGRGRTARRPADSVRARSGASSALGHAAAAEFSRGAGRAASRCRRMARPARRCFGGIEPISRVSIGFR